MCKAFSCLVLKSGEVKWKFAVDSHSDLVTSFGIRDNTADPQDMTFARVEITPANGDYLHPNKWVFNIDQAITPAWWTNIDEKAAWKAHSQWKRKLSQLVVKGPIVHPFKVKSSQKITAKHLAALKQWNSVWASVWASVRASVWASVWASVRASVWAYTGSFFKLSRKGWKYTDKVEGDGYPFEPAVYLWESGLVPSFDGKKWRLHGGKDAKVLWEGEV